MAYRYTLSNGTIVNSYQDENNLTEKYNQLNSLYDFISLDEHTAFSEEFTHEYLNEKVIVGCLQREKYKTLANDIFASAHRLFCIESKTSFVYITGGYWNSTPSFLPEKAFVTSVTEHIAEDNRPTPTNYNKYKKYFFKLTSDLAKSEYNITLGDNTDEFICALVEGNTIKSVRKVEPDPDKGDAILENWEALYILNAKKTKNREYVAALTNSGYV